MGSFTPAPWFFWHERTNGEGMQAFSKQPSGQTSPPPPKRQVVCLAISCFKTSTSFETFTRRPHIRSLRGSRSPFHKDADFLDDFSITAKNADIFNQFQYVFFRVVLVDSIFISWLQFFSRQCISFRIYLLMLYIVFIIVMTKTPFLTNNRQ